MKRLLGYVEPIQLILGMTDKTIFQGLVLNRFSGKHITIEQFSRNKHSFVVFLLS